MVSDVGHVNCFRATVDRVDDQRRTQEVSVKLLCAKKSEEHVDSQLSGGRNLAQAGIIPLCPPVHQRRFLDPI